MVQTYLRGPRGVSSCYECQRAVDAYEDTCDYFTCCTQNSMRGLFGMTGIDSLTSKAAVNGWISNEDFSGDLERLIGVLVTPWVNQSHPLMHDDELRAECRAKLAYILNGGFLSKCSSRAKAFAFIKTSLRNHLRSLVQKYVFTEKRTGVKPPPKMSSAADGALAQSPEKVGFVWLDDDENHFEIGAMDSGFALNEFLEELHDALTPVERIIFQKLASGEETLIQFSNSKHSNRQIREMTTVIRFKAKSVLVGKGVNVSTETTNHQVASNASHSKYRSDVRFDVPARMRGKLAKTSVSEHYYNLMSESGIELTREEFYQSVWTTPACHLCKKWGITNVQFVELCEKFEIPRPGGDYWPLIRLGRTVERAPMPQSTGNMPGLIKIEPKPKKAAPSVQPKSAQPAETESSKLPGQAAAAPPSVPTITVENDFRKAHGLIRLSRTQLETRGPDQYGRVGPGWREKCVNIVTTKQHLRRALLILDAIFRGLEAKGHKAQVVQKENNQFETGIKIANEFVRVKMMEKTTQKERTLSAEEKQRSYLYNRYSYEPTGNFTFSIEEYWVSSQKSWSDSIRGKLETLLGEIVEGIIVAGEKLRLRRIEEQEEQRRRAEEDRKAMELRRLREQEKGRRQALEQNTDFWDKADRLRAFIGACEARLANTGKLADNPAALRWLEWARQHADEIDPLNSDYLASAIHSLPENPIKIVSREISDR